MTSTDHFLFVQCYTPSVIPEFAHEAGQQRKREREQQKRRRTIPPHQQQYDDDQYDDTVNRERRWPSPIRTFQLRSVSPKRHDLPPRPPAPARIAPTRRPTTPPRPPPKTPPAPPRSQRTQGDERERHRPSRSASRPRFTGPRWTAPGSEERRRQQNLHETFHPRRDEEQWEDPGWHRQTHHQQHWQDHHWTPPAYRPTGMPIGMAPQHWESDTRTHQYNPRPRWQGYPPRGPRGYNPYFREKQFRAARPTLRPNNFVTHKAGNSITRHFENALGRDMHMSCKAGPICTKSAITLSRPFALSFC